MLDRRNIYVFQRLPQLLFQTHLQVDKEKAIVSMSMMMRGLRSTALWLILALGTMGASFQVSNQTTPGALSLQATINSIGIRAPFTGDGNTNNSASIRYRP
jgi:hypothetical protein